MSESTAGPHGPHRRALVTGASSGIGESFARRLARDGYDLVVVARSREPLETLAKTVSESHAVETEVLVADLVDPAELSVVEARVAEEPGFDLVVNNAGIGTVGAFAESDLEGEMDEIELNVVALVRLTHAALGSMVPRGRGAVINVSSMAGFSPSPYTATYAATKAYVNSFSEALSEELRDTGVRIQALCPGFTRTRFQERAGIDASTVPDFAWMEADDVVDASLEALENDEVVCIPGQGNRVFARLSGMVPRRFVRRAIGAVQGRRLQK